MSLTQAQYLEEVNAALVKFGMPPEAIIKALSTVKFAGDRSPASHVVATFIFNDWSHRQPHPIVERKDNVPQV